MEVETRIKERTALWLRMSGTSALEERRVVLDRGRDGRTDDAVRAAFTRALTYVRSQHSCSSSGTDHPTEPISFSMHAKARVKKMRGMIKSQHKHKLHESMPLHSPQIGALVYIFIYAMG